MEEITAEHPEYIEKKQIWRTYRDLYIGGEQLKRNAASYLTRRQNEPLDVYGERLSRVFYENYVGSIVDWYAATLFRREPTIVAEGDDNRAKEFLGTFAEDCDCKGSSITEMFRRLMIETLVCGKSYVLVDFPRRAEPAGSRAEEDATGASRAYLVEYLADGVTNWSMDERGQYEWLVLRSWRRCKERVDSPEGVRETRWTYYDKRNYSTYRRLEGPGQRGTVELIDSGLHALSRLERVPVFELKVPEGLWLLNKAGLLQLEHLNKSNALSWALTMGLFAMPVVYSDREWNQIVGESYYIQLGPDDKFGWTEPEGHVYQVAAQNLRRLQEEIYRVCYLLSQGGSSTSSRFAQSGLSKLRDFSITQQVLRAYGDIVKETMKGVLNAVFAARQDRIVVDVSGLDDFDIGDFGSELAEGERLLQMGIRSPTLKAQIFKKLALKYLSDIRQGVKDRIVAEIEAEHSEGMK